MTTGPGVIGTAITSDDSVVASSPNPALPATEDIAPLSDEADVAAAGDGKGAVCGDGDVLFSKDDAPFFASGDSSDEEGSVALDTPKLKSGGSSKDDADLREECDSLPFRGADCCRFSVLSCGTIPLPYPRDTQQHRFFQAL